MKKDLDLLLDRAKKELPEADHARLCEIVPECEDREAWYDFDPDTQNEEEFEKTIPMFPAVNPTSLRNFLDFCQRAMALGASGIGAMVARSAGGELDFMAIDGEIGDLSIRFRENGEAWAIAVGDGANGSVETRLSGSLPAADLLTERASVDITPWIRRLATQDAEPGMAPG